jgi:general secretion pathway protein F
MNHVTYYEDGIRKEADYSGSDKELRTRLSAEGKVVIKIHKPIALFRPTAKRKELAPMLIAVGDLLKAGVPLSKSLETTLQSLPKGSALIAIVNAMKDAVKEGRELSSALSVYRNVVGNTTISIIEAGEKSGRLTESLLGAAESMINVEKSQHEMKKTLFYPIVVFIMSLVALVINTQFVIPKIMASPLITTAFKGKETVPIKALTALTRIVPVAFAVILVAVMIIVILYKSRQEQMENLLLSIPLTKKLFFYHGFYVAFFSMSKLMAAGVQLARALEIIKDTSKIIAIRTEFNNAMKKVKDGENFSHGFSCISPIERAMLDVAQNSDRVTENLALVADRFYRGYMENVKSLGPKVYAFALIFAGGIFLLLVMGIMIPYSKLLGGVHG